MAAGFTTLIYNCIQIRNCNTTRFEQVTLYDDSHTDQVGTKYTISVIGYIHYDPNARITVLAHQQPAPTSAADLWSDIRNALMVPRAGFSYFVGTKEPANNGECILAVMPPVPGDINLFVMGPIEGPFSIVGAKNLRDTQSGPRPISCEIQQITGNTVFRVQYTIELHVADCDNITNPNESGVLSNRWSMSDSIDDNLMTTRRLKGRLMLANSTFNAHAFRNFVVPRLQRGMRRQHMNFEVTSDSLHLNYEVVDKEIAFSAPYPATRWHVVYTESAQHGDNSAGMCANASLIVELEGHRDVKRKLLLTLAATIVDARLNIAGAPNNGVIIRHIEVTDEYGTDIPNRVRLAVSISRTPENGVALASVITAKIGEPISAQDLAPIVANYDSHISFGGEPNDPIYLSGPIPLTTAWGCYLQTPCSSIHDIQQQESHSFPAPCEDVVFLQSSALNNGLAQIPATQPVPLTFNTLGLSGAIVPSLPPVTLQPQLEYSNMHADAIYQTWQYDTKNQTSHHRIALPRAGTSTISGNANNADTLKVVTIAQPTTHRISRITATRVGKVPSLPNPVSRYTLPSGGEAVLIRTAILASPPYLSSDRKQVFEIIAEYIYALTRPVLGNDPLDCGYNPWSGLSSSQQLLNVQENSNTP